MSPSATRQTCGASGSSATSCESQGHGEGWQEAHRRVPRRLMTGVAQSGGWRLPSHLLARLPCAAGRPAARCRLLWRHLVVHRGLPSRPLTALMLASLGPSLRRPGRGLVPCNLPSLVRWVCREGGREPRCTSMWAAPHPHCRGTPAATVISESCIRTDE